MSADENTTELLARAADGDEHAVGQLFARYRQRLRRTVNVRLDPRLRDEGRFGLKSVIAHP